MKTKMLLAGLVLFAFTTIGVAQETAKKADCPANKTACCGAKSGETKCNAATPKADKAPATKTETTKAPATKPAKK